MVEVKPTVTIVSNVNVVKEDGTEITCYTGESQHIPVDRVLAACSLAEAFGAPMARICVRYYRSDELINEDIVDIVNIVNKGVSL